MGAASARRLGHREENGACFWVPHSGTKQDAEDSIRLGLFNGQVSLSTMQHLTH